jgi:hypothetical protein
VNREGVEEQMIIEFSKYGPNIWLQGQTKTQDSVRPADLGPAISRTRTQLVIPERTCSPHRNVFLGSFNYVFSAP